MGHLRVELVKDLQRNEGLLAGCAVVDDLAELRQLVEPAQNESLSNSNCVMQVRIRLENGLAHQNHHEIRQ